LRRVAVPIRGRTYTIHIAPGALAHAGEIIRRHASGRQALLVTDKNVDRYYGGRVERNLRSAGFLVSRHVSNPGERGKTLSAVRRIYESMAEAGLDRSSAVVALGGGVVGDVAGFAAATWHRGVPLFQIPTTLLAQVDAAVGGKTGVNLPSGKNLVGAFHQPSAVVADPDSLATLPVREYRAGLGEVVKYGMIRDARFFRRLEENADAIIGREGALLAAIIERCCRIKAEYVAADERDSKGYRAQLNYGHTFGHAVEAATGYRRYRHGEAVALGMVCAARISEELRWISSGERERLVRLLRRFTLPTDGVPLSPEQLLPLFQTDKKRVGERLGFVLTKGIGSASFHPSLPRPLLVRGLREICNLPRRR
jgi:3-dehydroquinate synthase